jgi:nicotinamide mononucleotide transporter
LEHLIQTITGEMSGLEIFAAVITLLAVYLAVRANLWTWPLGIVSVLLYGYIFYTYKLYSSAGLQLLYFLPMQFYGWWMWLRGGPLQENDLPITTLNPVHRAALIGINIPLTFGLGYGMGLAGAHLSYADALATSMSIIAQFLMARKHIECWVFWILVDVLYVFYILPSQKLYATLGLYAILLGMATMGLLQWLKMMRAQRYLESIIESGELISNRVQ